MRAERRAEHFTICGMVTLLRAANDIAKDLMSRYHATLPPPERFALAMEMGVEALSQCVGFGRFCRQHLGVERLMVLRGYGSFHLNLFQR